MEVTRIDIIRRNAMVTSSILTSSYEPSQSELATVQMHLEDCAKTPTIALVYRKACIDAKRNHNFEKKIAILAKNPVIAEVYEQSKNAMKTHYEKTMGLREKLIKTGRVSIGDVKPKMSHLQKMLFK